jgi:hypothetical protein
VERTTATWAALLLAVGGCPLDPAHLPELTFDLSLDDTWPSSDLAPAPGAGDGRVLVTNNLDDTVSVLDLDALLRGDDALLAHVPVGFVPVEREGPHHLVADGAGEFYYLGISNFVPGSGSGPHGQHGSGTADGHIMKMRIEDNTLVADVRIDRNPGDVRLTPDGRMLLASHFDLLRVIDAAQDDITTGPELDARLAIIDPKTMTRTALVPACPAAHGIGVTPDSRLAVMSCVSDEVAIIDLVDEAHPVTRLAVIDNPGTAALPTCFPYAVTMEGATAWVSCFTGGALIAVDAVAGVLDGRTLQLLGNVAMFGDVRDGIMAIAHQDQDGVTFIDASVPELLSFRLFARDECLLPHLARWSEGGTEVLVVCEGDHSAPGALVVVDAQEPHDILATEALGIFPDDIAMARRPP